MKLKLLILMVLALTVTACNNELEARVTALEERIESVCVNTEPLSEKFLSSYRGIYVRGTLEELREVRGTFLETTKSDGGKFLHNIHEHAHYLPLESLCEDVTGLDTTD